MTFVWGLQTKKPFSKNAPYNRLCKKHFSEVEIFFLLLFSCSVNDLREIIREIKMPRCWKKANGKTSKYLYRIKFSKLTIFTFLIKTIKYQTLKRDKTKFEAMFAGCQLLQSNFHRPMRRFLLSKRILINSSDDYDYPKCQCDLHKDKDANFTSPLNIVFFTWQALCNSVNAT